ncbi:hypothetical protein ASE04_25480 [Rhizobium sp. Root708]|nr:hypothetical protein ASE04_25480 [Rhizobium sp. Root708]
MAPSCNILIHTKLQMILADNSFELSKAAASSSAIATLVQAWPTTRIGGRTARNRYPTFSVAPAQLPAMGSSFVGFKADGTR